MAKLPNHFIFSNLFQKRPNGNPGENHHSAKLMQILLWLCLVHLLSMGLQALLECNHNHESDLFWKYPSFYAFRRKKFNIYLISMTWFWKLPKLLEVKQKKQGSLIRLSKFFCMFTFNDIRYFFRGGK